MMKVEATKQFKFAMAHCLDDAYSKECKNIHGHNYVLEVTISCNKRHLDDNGMVIDFKQMKEIITPIVNEFDHKFIDKEKFGKNPTAENMALYFFDSIKRKLINVEKVRLFETDTGWVTVGY